MPSDLGVNQKYRERMARKDWFGNVQAPYLEQSTEFLNAKVKSHYVRYFDLTSINIHFIENAAALLQCAEICSDLVDKLIDQVESVIRNVDSEIIAYTHAAMQVAENNGVKVSAKFFQEPLRVEVRLLSPICFCYLDALQKTDGLILILENLRLRGVIKRGECDRQIAKVDHLLKSIQRTAFGLGVGLRRRAGGSRSITKSITKEDHAPIPTESSFAMTSPVALTAEEAKAATQSLATTDCNYSSDESVPNPLAPVIHANGLT
jgi:hypothetical protein